MKRILFCIIALVVVISLFACSNEDGRKESTESDTAELSDSSIFDNLDNINLDDYVKLGKYIGIEYEKTEAVYKEELLTEKIDAILSEHSKETETDGPAKNGDTLTIEYVGRMDGEVFEGGSTSSPVEIKLGSSGYISGFDDGLIGIKKGETRDLDLKFPDPYNLKKEYSGKAVVFTVTCNKIVATQKPEFNDEFAASVSEYKTAKEYSEKLKADVISELEEEAYVKDMSAIWQIAFDNATIFSCPQDEVDRYYAKYQSVYAQEAASYNMTLSDYISANGITEDVFSESIRSKAESRVKTELVLYAISKAENITVNEDEYNKWIEDYIAENEEGLTRAQFDEKYSSSDVRASMISDKVIRFVYDNAVAKAQSTTANTSITSADVTTQTK